MMRAAWSSVTDSSSSPANRISASVVERDSTTEGLMACWRICWLLMLGWIGGMIVVVSMTSVVELLVVSGMLVLGMLV